MSCSIGVVLNQDHQCEKGTQPQPFSSIDTIQSEIIAQRVRAQLNFIPIHLQNVCQTHYTQFYSSYKEYQKLCKGCCSKFHPESVSPFINTLQITKGFSEKYSLWQKIGRCARDGNPGVAIIMRQGKDQFQLNKCLREQILSQFLGYEPVSYQDLACTCINVSACSKTSCCWWCILQCRCMPLPIPTELCSVEVDDACSEEGEDLDWSFM